MDAPSAWEARQPKLVTKKVFLIRTSLCLCVFVFKTEKHKGTKTRKLPVLLRNFPALLGNGLLELLFTLCQFPGKFLIAESEDLKREESGVGRAGFAYAHCCNGDAGGHLHRRQ